MTFILTLPTVSKSQDVEEVISAQLAVIFCVPVLLGALATLYDAATREYYDFPAEDEVMPSYFVRYDLEESSKTLKPTGFSRVNKAPVEWKDYSKWHWIFNNRLGREMDKLLQEKLTKDGLLEYEQKRTEIYTATIGICMSVPSKLLHKYNNDIIFSRGISMNCIDNLIRVLKDDESGNALLQTMQDYSLLIREGKNDVDLVFFKVEGSFGLNFPLLKKMGFISLSPNKEIYVREK